VTLNSLHCIYYYYYFLSFPLSVNASNSTPVGGESAPKLFCQLPLISKEEKEDMSTLSSQSEKGGFIQ